MRLGFRQYRTLICLAACLATAACSRPNLAGEMAACLPQDITAVAGIHLDQVRSGDLARSLPPAWLAALEPFREASTALVAYNGKGLLLIAAGRFRTPPAGTVLATPQLALGGSREMVRAATEQHAIHQTGAAGLMTQAAPILDKPIWAVVRGGARLPLSGNSANAGRLLQLTQYTTMAADWDSGMRINLTGYCSTPEAALRLEETLRAMVTLAGSAIHAPDLAPLLESVQIRRQGAAVYVNLLANRQALEYLLQ